MDTKTAKDIMIPIEKYPHVSHMCTLREAIVEIEKISLEVNRRKSLPRALLVFDDKNQLLGIVRRRDILRGLEPKFLQNIPSTLQKKLFDVEVDPNLVEISFGKDEKIFQEHTERPVSNVMLPISATINHDDHLAKIIYTMVSRNLALLPVLKDKTVVGVVRSVDVFHEVSKLLN